MQQQWLVLWDALSKQLNSEIQSPYIYEKTSSLDK
jgi:hypothetical protein